MQQQFSKLEKSINELNQQKTQHEAELGKPVNYSDKNTFAKLEADYKAVQQKIALAEKEYETLFEKIMLAEAI